MDADESCGYRPQSDVVIEPIVEFVGEALTWSDEAVSRLGHIPGFIRELVKKRTESYVSDLGETRVTLEHMKQLSARRFGTPPWQRPGSKPNHS